MITTIESIVSLALLVLLIFCSYPKWKKWDEAEDAESETGPDLENVEKQKNKWILILQINAFIIFLPLTHYIATISHEKITSLISILGLSVFIKILDYLAKGFFKSKSKILHLAFLSIIGFTIIPEFK